MNLNATLLGQFIMVFVPVMFALGYYLGKRKTQTPFLTASIGAVSALFFPFAFIFLLVLVLKRDITSEQTS